MIAEDKPQGGEGEDPIELLTAGGLARRLKISLRHVRTMDSESLLPAPLRLGRCVRWRGSEIGKWVKAGCPNRTAWQKREDTERETTAGAS